MNYKVVDYSLQNRSYSDLIINCKNSKEQTEINFLNRNDYNFVGSVSILEETFLSFINGGEIILYHFNKPGYYKVDIATKDKLFVQKDLVPEYTWESGVILYLDRVNRCYKCILDDGKEVFSFESKYPISNQWFKHGVLYYQNDGKENNWIKCLDPNGGQEKWEVNLPWKFVRLETHKSIIVLEYHAYDKIRTDEGYKGERDWYHPNRYTIVLNGDTGQELWRHPFTYTKIDRTSNTILFGGEIFKEVELNSGRVITEVQVRSYNNSGCLPHFTDDAGIYYLSNDHSFGKVSKSNGTVQWEFDLIDDKGEKRKLSDWLLLGNGNLVLQAMPNHHNGDLTCIFNPEENLEFSKVKEGVRLDTAYP